MNEVQFTWKRRFEAGWSLLWRFFLYGVIGGAIASFVAGIVGLPFRLELIPYDLYWVSVPLAAIGVCVVIASLILVYSELMRALLKVKFSDFRIALVPTRESSESQRYDQT